MQRLIDKTKVTCLKWLPRSPNLFLASHSSGHLYLYNEELPCTPTSPSYQNFKSGDGFTILTCKSKSTRNPLYKWTFNTENCCINEFCFSPCGSMLAIASQDGFLRVFHYDTMELLGIARSYFGGFLCVCWSPDSKYIVVGGEDDLVTVWSLHERRVVARGQGHRSWVSVVAFDPFTSFSYCDSTEFSDDDIGTSVNDTYNIKSKTTESIPSNSKRNIRNSRRDSLAPDKVGTSYRLGSVGQDTQLCLWDITEDILRQSYEKRHRLGSHDPQRSDGSDSVSKINKKETDSNYNSNKISAKFATSNSTSSHSNDIDAHCSNSESNKHLNSSNKINGNNSKSNVMDNCVNAIGNCNSINKNDSGTGANAQSDVVVNNSNSKSHKSSSGESSLAALNTITQRLTNFSFGNDRKSGSSSHKKTFAFSKSSGNHANCLNSVSNGIDDHDSTYKNDKNSVIISYDPMKLIGTNSCPRFDECPILEPLVCKKIAHERLTALIFREDCFLTACQDGFIYTWARPGFSVSIYHIV